MGSKSSKTSSPSDVDCCTKYDVICPEETASSENCRAALQSYCTIDKLFSNAEEDQKCQKFCSSIGKDWCNAQKLAYCKQDNKFASDDNCKAFCKGYDCLTPICPSIDNNGIQLSTTECQDYCNTFITNTDLGACKTAIENYYCVGSNFS